MKAVLSRLVPFLAIPILTVLLLWLAVAAVVRQVASANRPDDPEARLPKDVELSVRIEDAEGAVAFAERALGIDGAAARKALGLPGGAPRIVAGVRGREAVLIVECEPWSMLTPMDTLAAEALGLRPGPGGAFERGGRRVWLASRRNVLYVATSEGLLGEALARHDEDGPAPPVTAGVVVRDRGLVESFRKRELKDLAGYLHGKLKGQFEPGMTAAGTIGAGGLELSGRFPSSLPEEEFAAIEQARRPPLPSRLAAQNVPGLAWMHVERFVAPAVWQEIVRDPDNARFVGAFRKEIEEYEKFLGGRDFETDLLPKLGPERAFAVARIPYAEVGVKPKSPLPAILFAVECRGIEAEVMKTLDKFLVKAEKEGQRFDLPAPRGAVAPEVDPFRHQEMSVDGRRIVRIVFREGISDFGSEFSPGYAVLDGVLWITTFWPILRDIGPGTTGDRGLHQGGALDGPAARAILMENAEELAGMFATWDLLDRLAPSAATDFAARYGKDGRWLEPMLGPFTELEEELKRERPDLKGGPFDLELDRRLEAWISQEQRAFAAKRAEPLKATDEFRADVAERKRRFERHVRLFNAVRRVEWTAERSFEPGEVRWRLKLSLAD